jgi:hypothetical protein
MPIKLIPVLLYQLCDCIANDLQLFMYISIRENAYNGNVICHVSEHCTCHGSIIVYKVCIHQECSPVLKL